jgi:feruloyl esterase
MLPGVCHCGGGDGPFLFDALGTIDQWAASGAAPERIVAMRPPGGPATSRPLCPYPAIAKYSGKGDVADAASFVCAAPRK